MKSAEMPLFMLRIPHACHCANDMHIAHDDNCRLHVYKDSLSL